MGLFTEYDGSYDAGVERGIIIVSGMFSDESGKIMEDLENPEIHTEDKYILLLDNMLRINSHLTNMLNSSGEEVNAEYERSKDLKSDEPTDLQREQMCENCSEESSGGE